MVTSVRSLLDYLYLPNWFVGRQFDVFTIIREGYGETLAEEVVPDLRCVEAFRLTDLE